MGKAVGIGRGSPSGAFTPKGVSSKNLISWHKAAVENVTIATGVSNWVDLSGNSYNASQATGSAQPALDASTMNGRYSLSFTANNSYLLLPDSHASFITGDDKPICSYSTARFVNISNSLYATLWGFAQNTATGHVLDLYGGFGASLPIALEKRDTTTTAAQANGLSNNTNYIIRCDYTGTAVTIYVNNVLFVNNVTLNKAAVTLEKSGFGCIPRPTPVISNASMFLGEQIIFDGPLTTSENDSLYTYLKNYWGFG